MLIKCWLWVRYVDDIGIAGQEIDICFYIYKNSDIIPFIPFVYIYGLHVSLMLPLVRKSIKKDSKV